MTDIVERLRLTTEQMANNCSVNMLLWCEHSGAALEAADEIERLRLSLSEARGAGRREGLSEALELADAAREEWENSAKRWHRDGMLKTAAASLIHSEASSELAAAIRAAMEKAE